MITSSVIGLVILAVLAAGTTILVLIGLLLGYWDRLTLVVMVVSLVTAMVAGYVALRTMRQLVIGN